MQKLKLLRKVEKVLITLKRQKQQAEVITNPYNKFTKGLMFLQDELWQKLSIYPATILF